MGVRGTGGLGLRRHRRADPPRLCEEPSPRRPPERPRRGGYGYDGPRLSLPSRRTGAQRAGPGELYPCRRPAHPGAESSPGAVRPTLPRAGGARRFDPAAAAAAGSCSRGGPKRHGAAQERRRAAPPPAAGEDHRPDRAPGAGTPEPAGKLVLRRAGGGHPHPGREPGSGTARQRPPARRPGLRDRRPGTGLRSLAS